MKYNFGKPLTATYNEMTQINPIQWEMLYRDGDGFIPQTAKFKCKDFLNDVVAKYHGVDLDVYRMAFKPMEFNDEGLWLRLHNIQDFPTFSKNIANLINNNVPTERAVVIEPLDSTTVLAFIPRYYFNQTYLISVVSYLIRVSNYKVVFNNVEEFFSSTARHSEPAVNEQGKRLMLAWGFEVPEKYQEYWYYAGASYNSKKGVDMDYQSIVHNNGVSSWSAYVNAKDLVCDAAVAM